MRKTTQFSECRRYRYTLWREWGSSGLFHSNSDRYLMVVGLNPSTADETLDDPTIRKCIGFAKRWGFGALCMTNLFAFRATDPKVMMSESDPVGPECDEWLWRCADGTGSILAAWGNHGSHLGRASTVSQMFPDLICLGTNKDGSPKHPLYVSYEQPIIPFKK